MQITDVNDEVPIFSRPLYQFSIHEGTSTGAIVGTVNATDRDSNKDIYYSISQTTGYDINGDIINLETVSKMYNIP